MPRAVILVGPPKTGSSHVQAFLANNQEFLESHGWQWPRSVDGGRAGAKSYANLVSALAGKACRSTIWKDAPTLVDAIVSLCHGRPSEIAAYQRPAQATLHRYSREFERAYKSRRSVVLSAEDLAYFDGDDPTSVGVRRSLRSLLSKFDDVTAVIVYRTPRAAAVQSTFTEELDWGWDGVELGARTPFSTWLFEKLHDGSLLQRAPWSSALNLARLADAYAASGYKIQLVSSSGAAEDGLDVSDVVACEVLGLPCTAGKATWSRYGDRRTYETRFDSVAFSAMMALQSSHGCVLANRHHPGRALQAAPGATEGQGHAKDTMRKIAAEVPRLLVEGATKRCSDLGALETFFARFEDASLLARYGGEILHWHGRRNGSAPRMFCELDTSREATRAALQRMAQRLGYACAAPAASVSPPTAQSDPPAAGSTLAQPSVAMLQRELVRSRGVHHAAWFYGTLCSPAAHCHLLDGVASALGEATRRGAEFSVVLQTEEMAASVRRVSAADGACARPDAAPPTRATGAAGATAAPRMLYTLLTNPFAGERCCYRGTRDQPQGDVPPNRVLAQHLEALAVLPTRLAALMLLLPYDDARPPIPGYLDVASAVERLPFGASLRTLPNNTLGSYGMYLHAFASTRGWYEYYLFAEDDYTPVAAHFDTTLIRLYRATFGNVAAGCIAGVLQGRPVEPHSPFALHLESSHIMSAAGLTQLYAHVYTERKWNGSTASLMIALAKGQATERRASDYGRGPVRSSGTYYGNLQLGFGKLLHEAGVDVRDWSAAYRTPYWNHHQLVDWTGPMHRFSVPMERVLIAPVQWLYPVRLKQCCAGVDCDTVDAAAADVCATSRQSADPDACCQRRSRTHPPDPSLRWLRQKWSLPPRALAVATNASADCRLMLVDGRVVAAAAAATSASNRATEPPVAPRDARASRRNPPKEVRTPRREPPRRQSHGWLNWLFGAGSRRFQQRRCDLKGEELEGRDGVSSVGACESIATAGGRTNMGGFMFNSDKGRCHTYARGTPCAGAAPPGWVAYVSVS